MVTLFAIACLLVNKKVLLARRAHASFGNGLYSMVGGKVEENETARAAIKREILEEIAIDIPIDKFELAHTLHRKGTDNKLIALCFVADITGLNIFNNEPDKCDDLRFFDLHSLPENIIPAHKQAIECILKQVTYSEHGW